MENFSIFAHGPDLDVDELLDAIPLNSTSSGVGEIR